MSEVFDRLLAEGPEAKLELINGYLIVGNTLAASRYLLREILSSWGPRAALPLAARALWWEALAQAFRPDPRPRTEAEWEAWATHYAYEPLVVPVGPRFNPAHQVAYQRLLLTLYAALEHSQLGRCLGRDFVMRLGDNAFTPDLLVVGRERLAYLNPMYFDGPADIVIEILLPGHTAQDTGFKRRTYAQGGVPEYWIVDAETQFVEFLRLRGGAYQPQGVDADGRYRPVSVPGLACAPERLWEADNLPLHLGGVDLIAIEVPVSQPLLVEDPMSHDLLGWDSLPFEPRVALAPQPIGFNQYIAWCPRAKFEGSEERWPIIGGPPGTRNVLGMLLMTFGLTETVRLLHPMTWLVGLAADVHYQAQDAARRAAWWALARQAAALLRARFGVTRVGLIGDLAHPTPLNVWSEITLVVWDLPRANRYDAWEALCALHCDPRVVLVEAQRATPAQKVAIARRLVAL